MNKHQVQLQILLHDACASGKLSEVKTALLLGADINKSHLGQTWYPLAVAVKNRHYHVVSYLLEAGAVPNASMGQSLQLAVEQADETAVRLLLTAKALPTTAQQVYRQPFRIAAEKAAVASSESAPAYVTFRTFLEFSIPPHECTKVLTSLFRSYRKNLLGRASSFAQVGCDLADAGANTADVALLVQSCTFGLFSLFARIAKSHRLHHSANECLIAAMYVGAGEIVREYDRLQLIAREDSTDYLRAALRGAKDDECIRCCIANNANPILLPTPIAQSLFDQTPTDLFLMSHDIVGLDLRAVPAEHRCEARRLRQLWSAFRDPILRRLGQTDRGARIAVSNRIITDDKQLRRFLERPKTDTLLL